MKNANIGTVNLIVSKKLKDFYFSNTLNEDSKKLTIDFLEIVKNSPILQLEFKVFNNIENKFIDNDFTATRYIDNNIKLFEIYTLDEIDAERAKLTSIINEDNSSHFTQNELNKLKLYDAINSLITESLNDAENINIDNIHESFTIVLNHIKTPKVILNENVDTKSINDDVIEIAVEKFNAKYSNLNEDDRNLLQLLIKSNNKEKEKILESYKNESLILLEKVNKDGINDNIVKAIQKIKEMKFDSKKINDDIISLHELKKDLL